jgi:hypothetical protein
MDAQATIAQYDSALHQMLDENEALRAQLAQLRSEIDRLVSWINGDRDALTCLQAIYNNPGTDEGSRIKAASAAIGYERAKLSVSVQVTGPAVLGERLDRTKTMKTVSPPLIEHES